MSSSVSDMSPTDPSGLPPTPLRIVVADDHDLIRMALRAIIEGAPDRYEWTGEAATLATARALLIEQRPDLVIMDITMADENGLDLVEEARTLAPQTRFLVVSGHDDAVHVGRALKAGACGYVIKTNVLTEIHDALQAAGSGTTYLSPGLEQLPTMPELTPRQIDVLRGIARGLSAKMVARQLGISNKTVEFHKAELKKRLGVNDIASLALYAAQQGLLK